MLRFRSFRTRLTVFFVGLLLLVQGAAFIAVDLANSRNARRQINAELEVDARVFARLLASRTAQSTQAARLLSGDFAFKTAYASGDGGTLLSALRNHQARIKADVMVLYSLDAEEIASTLERPPGAEELDFEDIIEAADDSDGGEAAQVMLLDEAPYQVVLVPLLAPLPVAWIGIGFRLDEAFVAALEELTRADVSLLRRSGEVWRVEASTLTAPAALARALGSGRQPGRSFVLDLGGRDSVSLMQPLGDEGGGAVQVVLQRPLAAALAPYQRLRLALLVLTAVAFVISLFGASVIARGVTRPVETLVAATRRVQEGDYASAVAIDRADEIGELAGAFNAMTQGLAERDRVRDLLGKVVDPTVAEELLSKDLELGGEEREVSILFSDIRGFTALSERQRPAQLLDLLNRYLTRMSTAIEAEGGVVDKYIGDAIMALFGAPLGNSDDAARAIRAALAMGHELAELNFELRTQGLPEIATGIGINSGLVVAGNMGSVRRLNYTVIGDNVNLASRIEGLTRIYGVPLIVSESTAAAPGFRYRELDRVRVKGKQEPVRIFEPLDPDASGSPGADELERYHQALAHYRAREWQQADDVLGALTDAAPDCPVYALYRRRISQFQGAPPPAGWQGIEVFSEK
ncbi:MAG: adenylate/guanylate cyclase domain-containing protein [Alphaproteobacteria bacterium]|nr:adenylate/guanylate cyclase domain-containing protein [Alphaproteobacteria bacterium]